MIINKLYYSSSYLRIYLLAFVFKTVKNIKKTLDNMT